MKQPFRHQPSLPFLLSLCFLLVATVKSTADVTVTIGLNFNGASNGTNSQALPPDPNGVIGPTRFMEFVNGSVGFFNRTNPASVIRISDLKFWANAGLNVSAISVSDPRVIYDPTIQRWFATEVDYDPNASDPTAEANDFLLAVSTTANPLDPWKGFMFLSDPDNGYFADFPTLGVDGNAVYISGDFYSAGEVPQGPGLVSIPKADLIAATPTIANQTWYGVMAITNRGQVMQPVTCLDGSETGTILAMSDVGDTSDFYSNAVVSVVQNAGTTSPTLLAPMQLNVLPYQVPDNPDAGVPLFVASQPDGTTSIQANDARLSAKVFAVGGILYAVHSTEFNGRIAIRWYRIRASDQTVLEQGTISDPNLDLYFPSIAANQYGTVVICCNGSSLNSYINCYAYAGQTVNGQTAFGSAILLQAGVANYHDLNDISGQILGSPTPSRWGDYGTLSVDPADPTQFWSIQMYPSGVDSSSGFDVGIWSTKITQLFVTSSLTLAIAPAGNNVLVTWPLSAANYQLQSTTNLVATNSWSTISTGISTNGQTISALIAKSAGASFFRLAR